MQPSSAGTMDQASVSSAGLDHLLFYANLKLAS